MPELPEVETVRRGLEKLIREGAIVSVVDLRTKKIRFDVPRDFKKKLLNAVFRKVTRRAKYLLFDFGEITLVSHLGMTGSWRSIATVDREADQRKHDHLYIEFSNGLRLAFNDPRRFGIIDLEKDISKSRWLKHLGPEPFDPVFAAELFKSKARAKTSTIKTFLMDQKNVVGVGNIYASEALFLAGVRPQRRAGKVTMHEWERLIGSIRNVLNRAIEAGGTTLQDHRQVSGETGGFQNRLKVYDRKGEACVNCKSPIKQTVIGGRATYWCPKCQK